MKNPNIYFLGERFWFCFKVNFHDLGTPGFSTSPLPENSTTTTETTTPEPPEETKFPDFVTLGEEYAMAMWSPDLFFPDAVDIKRPGKGQYRQKRSNTNPG